SLLEIPLIFFEPPLYLKVMSRSGVFFLVILILGAGTGLWMSLGIYRHSAISISADDIEDLKNSFPQFIEERLAKEHQGSVIKDVFVNEITVRSKAQVSLN